MSASAYDPGAHLSIEDVLVDSRCIKAGSIPPGSDHLSRENALSGGGSPQLHLSAGFRYEDGQPLTYAALVREIWAALIGSATSAAAAVVEDALIG